MFEISNDPLLRYQSRDPQFGYVEAKTKLKKKVFKLPDFTPDDVKEALTEYIRNHPERFGRSI